MGAILLAGAAVLTSACNGPADEPVGAPTASPTPVQGAVLTVTVHDVVDVEGGSLAGVLYRGSEPLHDEAVGGFGVPVDADPFSVTTTVNEPGPPLRGLFPHVSDEELALSPGTHLLVIWADDVPLLPFSRWAPEPSDYGEPGLYVCQTTFEVGTSDLRLSIAGVPAEPLRPGPAHTPCTLD